MVHFRSSLQSIHDVFVSRLLTVTFTTATFRTEAAYGCLKPAPTSRLRRALIHLRHSTVFHRNTFLAQQTLEIFEVSVWGEFRPLSTPFRPTFPKKMLGERLLVACAARISVIRAQQHSRKGPLQGMSGAGRFRNQSKPRVEGDIKNFEGLGV